jgi:CRP-like cAMP-binding protein
MNAEMDALFGRLRHYSDVADGELLALQDLPHQVAQRGPGQTIVTLGEKLNSVFVLEDGWAMRHRMLSDGRRQIVNFMLPGDCFDLQSLVRAQADHFVTSITAVRLRVTGAAQFLAALRTSASLASAFWWAAVQEESVLREQIVRIGRRSARERVAHLILELHRRLTQAGLGAADAVELPLTREVMADALGLSPVHISRTLSFLRDRKLLSTNGRKIELLDPAGLARLAQFNDNYLHLDQMPRLPVEAAG